MKLSKIIKKLSAANIAFDATQPKEVLLAMLRGAQNKFTRTFDYAGGRGKISVTYNAAKTDDPAEIMICDDIGKDPWSGEGVTVKDIRETLNSITPKTRPLNFLVNSPGGSVTEGCAIRNILEEWAGDITKTIIGVAASTASWCIPADNVRAYKNSQIFMHRSMCFVGGNVDDLGQAIAYLTTTDEQIAEMYADQSGKPAAEMMDLMKNETLLTGQQAKDIGLVDEVIDGTATNQFTNEWLQAARQKLSALNKLRSSPQGEPTPNPTENTMNRQQKIALLNKRGLTTITNETTDAQLDTMLAESNIGRTINLGVLAAWNVAVDKETITDAELVTLLKNGKPAVPAPTVPPAGGLTDEERNEIKNLRAERVENRRRDIRTRLTNLASAEGGHRIPVNEIANWETQALAATDSPDGNPILNSLAKLPAQAPGLEPINELTPSGIEAGSASFADVQKHIITNGPGFRRQFLGGKAQNQLDERVLKDIGARALLVANCIAKNKAMLTAMFNSNAIDSDLQRQVILQDMLEAYALNLLPLEAFSVKYDNIPLQGLDTVVVPYFPLQATASTSFVKGTGYTTVSDWTENSRKVTIGGDGNAATSGVNATAGTVKDRLFQRIDFTSYDMRRQPYLWMLQRDHSL